MAKYNNDNFLFFKNFKTLMRKCLLNSRCLSWLSLLSNLLLDFFQSHLHSRLLHSMPNTREKELITTFVPMLLLNIPNIKSIRMSTIVTMFMKDLASQALLHFSRIDTVEERVVNPCLDIIRITPNII